MLLAEVRRQAAGARAMVHLPAAVSRGRCSAEVRRLEVRRVEGKRAAARPEERSAFVSVRAP